MDSHLYNSDGMFPQASTFYYPYFRDKNVSTPFSPNAVQELSDTVYGYFGGPNVVPTLAPFILYFLGALASFCAILTVAIIALWQKYKRLGDVRGLSLATAAASFAMTSISFVAYFVAIGLINSAMDKIINARTPNDDDTISGGHAFLAFAWVAVLAQAVASILMYCVFRRRWKGRWQSGMRRDVARGFQMATR